MVCVSVYTTLDYSFQSTEQDMILGHDIRTGYDISKYLVNALP